MPKVQYFFQVWSLDHLGRFLKIQSPGFTPGSATNQLCEFLNHMELYFHLQNGYYDPC